MLEILLSHWLFSVNTPDSSARALWYVGPEQVEIRPVALGALAADHCRIETLYTGISRGTESLVYRGQVPPSEYDRMGTPLMSGRLPFPVTFGYCNVGRVVQGTSDWVGKTVFCLGPHQTRFDAPTSMLAEIDRTLPASRAVLAANMETALNAVWTGKPGPCDQVAVVGGGVVGLLVAYLCQQLPGVDVTLVDPSPARRAICQSLGMTYSAEPSALTNCDLVFHASGHPAGLQDALSMAGNEATVIELSWYGTKPVSVNLGGAFHSQQLRLQSCQVGHVEPSHRPRWNYHRRLTAALALLHDPRLDGLLEPVVPFEDLPQTLHQILGDAQPRLCHIIEFS